MSRVLCALFSLIVFAQLGFPQQSRTFVRVGDVFKGPVKRVRTEQVQLNVKGDEVIEGSRSLFQVIDYSRDGLRRELKMYSRGVIGKITIETFLLSGSRESLTTFDAQGNRISKVTYQYDGSGSVISETRENPYSSVQSQTFVQTVRSAQGITAISRISDRGIVETDTNSRDETQKTSTWITNKANGSRQVNIHSLDPNKDHSTEQLTYNADGSLARRRVAITDRAVTRLEATEYNGNGTVEKRTLQTREYDEHRNLKKIVHYKWNSTLENFEPISATYHRIEYFE